MGQGQSEIACLVRHALFERDHLARGVGRRLDHPARAPVHHLGGGAHDVGRRERLIHETAQRFGRLTGEVAPGDPLHISPAEHCLLRRREHDQLGGVRPNAFGVLTPDPLALPFNLALPLRA